MSYTPVIQNKRKNKKCGKKWCAIISTFIWLSWQYYSQFIWIRQVIWVWTANKENGESLVILFYIFVLVCLFFLSRILIFLIAMCLCRASRVIKNAGNFSRRKSNINDIQKHEYLSFFRGLYSDIVVYHYTLRFSRNIGFSHSGAFVKQVKCCVGFISKYKPILHSSLCSLKVKIMYLSSKCLSSNGS